MWCLLHIESGEVNIAKVAIKRDIDEELGFPSTPLFHPSVASSTRRWKASSLKPPEVSVDRKVILKSSKRMRMRSKRSEPEPGSVARIVQH